MKHLTLFLLAMSLVLTVFLTGCEPTTFPVGNINTKIYEQVQQECPAKCYNKGKKWGGLLRLKPDISECVCEGEAPQCSLTKGK